MVHRLARIGFCVVVFISAAGVAHAAKDVVVTTSGDRLVGEFNVEKDVLTLSTDYSDADFKIKWDKIASIESDRQFLVESFDGKRVSGALKASAPTKSVVVADANLPLPEVALVQPFERTFWARFDAALDFGYSLTKTNSAKQLSLGGNLAYRDERNLDTLFVNVFRSSQADADDDGTLGSEQRFPPSAGHALVREHVAGPVEQRGTGPGPADHDWRRRRALPGPVGIAVPRPGGRARVDQREVHRPGAAVTGLG